MADGLSKVDGTLRQGLYQLHIDTLSTNTRLDDILSCLLDREEFERELARRRALAWVMCADFVCAFVLAVYYSNDPPLLSTSDLEPGAALDSKRPETS